MEFNGIIIELTTVMVIVFLQITVGFVSFVFLGATRRRVEPPDLLY